MLLTFLFWMMIVLICKVRDDRGFVTKSKL